MLTPSSALESSSLALLAAVEVAWKNADKRDTFKTTPLDDYVWRRDDTYCKFAIPSNQHTAWLEVLTAAYFCITSLFWSISSLARELNQNFAPHSSKQAKTATSCLRTSICLLLYYKTVLIVSNSLFMLDFF